MCPDQEPAMATITGVSKEINLGVESRTEWVDGVEAEWETVVADVKQT